MIHPSSTREGKFWLYMYIFTLRSCVVCCNVLSYKNKCLIELHRHTGEHTYCCSSVISSTYDSSLSSSFSMFYKLSIVVITNLTAGDKEFYIFQH